MSSGITWWRAGVASRCCVSRSASASPCWCARPGVIKPNGRSRLSRSVVMSRCSTSARRRLHPRSCIAPLTASLSTAALRLSRRGRSRIFCSQSCCTGACSSWVRTSCARAWLCRTNLRLRRPQGSGMGIWCLPSMARRCVRGRTCAGFCCAMRSMSAKWCFRCVPWKRSRPFAGSIWWDCRSRTRTRI